MLAGCFACVADEMDPVRRWKADAEQLRMMWAQLFDEEADAEEDEEEVQRVRKAKCATVATLGCLDGEQLRCEPCPVFGHGHLNCGLTHRCSRQQSPVTTTTGLRLFLCLHSFERGTQHNNSLAQNRGCQDFVSQAGASQ